MWYYAVGNERLGPVSDAELEELIRKGTLQQETLVWRMGMSNWQPLSVARLANISGGAGGLKGTLCTECGKYFPPTELITISGAQVCAQCKPVLLQRLAEGAAVVGASGMYWEGRRLVCRSETPFPDRCVKCNAPANGYRLKRVLYWQHPAYYLLILCNLLVLVIVLLIVRKKAVLHIGLCEQHRQSRRTAILVAWAAFLGGLGLVFAAINWSLGWMGLVGALAMVFGAIYGVVRGRSIAAAKIDKDLVWVTGVNPDFLNTGRPPGA